jgi:demethylmenaquinone methyltransferase/2-methoxy-6-polyprenyl-1,4-benzoquinol methylase
MRVFLGITGASGAPYAARTGRLSPEGVESMFDRIAPVYDAMNRAMTMGLDRRWRRLTAEAVVSTGDRVLDACCGTGELALAGRRLVGPDGSATGLDFSEEMLKRARRKSDEVEWIRGDLLSLPFANETFDAATVGFGVRNVDDLDRALRELRRVLKPGGRLAILEIVRPRGPLGVFFRAWFDGLVPIVGKVLPGGAAYSYLPASVRRFPGPEELGERVRAAGFDPVAHRLLGGGIVVLMVGESTADASGARHRTRPGARHRPRPGETGA